MCFLDSVVIDTHHAQTEQMVDRVFSYLNNLNYRNLKYPHGGICSEACTMYKHLTRTDWRCDMFRAAFEHPITPCKEGEYCDWFTHINRPTRKWNEQ